MGSRIAILLTACSQQFDACIAGIAHALGLPISRLKILVFTIAILCLLGLSASQITGTGHQVDALTNLRFAYNYYHHGVLSTDVSPPYLPSNAREPVPNIITSFHLRLLSLVLPDQSYSYLLQGEGAHAVKLVNLYWVVLGLVATALLTNELLGSFLLALLTTCLVGFFFFAMPIFVDTLYTEMQAAVMLLWACWFLLLTASRGKTVDYILAGISLGLLSLTKAIFFYISLVLLAFLLLRSLWVYRRSAMKTLRQPAAVATIAGFSFTLMPWMLRNKLELGTIQLTQRGGRVMYTRAIQNRMQNQEIPGAIYFWGPSFYRHASRLMGFGAMPEDFQAGGRYQRINRESSNFKQADLAAVKAGRPQDVVSYMRKTGAEVTRITYQAAAMGVADPYRYAEKKVGEQAKRMILADPIRHLIMTPLFLWRGIWSWPNQGVMFRVNGLYIIMKDIFSLVAYLSMITLFVFGMIRRNAISLSITVLPVGMLLAYGLLTHNIPRYSTPAIPMMIISMVVLIDRAMDRFSVTRLRNG